MFPISRDPHKGGTRNEVMVKSAVAVFPISRDPHKGGPKGGNNAWSVRQQPEGFQFLGIPTKGEHFESLGVGQNEVAVSNF